ncbi:hypothetical protein L596_012428 [Steinernema carpocapsae]|uniref:Uncharacterized protein n=1 Tax=Steinernema carpocapsae TaxID=34508 RepID=A0A4U5NX17_STECR|nr:hypothetical protein L596_012428 [Steinernema carpocapsae]
MLFDGVVDFIVSDTVKVVGEALDKVVKAVDPAEVAGDVGFFGFLKNSQVETVSQFLKRTFKYRNLRVFHSLNEIAKDLLRFFEHHCFGSIWKRFMHLPLRSLEAL